MKPRGARRETRASGKKKEKYLRNEVHNANAVVWGPV